MTRCPFGTCLPCDVVRRRGPHKSARELFDCARPRLRRRQCPIHGDKIRLGHPEDAAHCYRDDDIHARVLAEVFA